jgi:hypothetical protein
MLTSKPTHGGGAPFGVDLDAGVAKITVRRPAPAAEAADEAEQPLDRADQAPPVPEPPTS